MRYELLLQPREPSAPFEPAPLEALLDAKPVKLRPDGVRVWTLPAGDVEVSRVLDAGVPVALSIAVSFADREALVREALSAALELAEAAGARVVDPALGRAVRAGDEAVVLESFQAAARYAGEYLGVGSAVGERYAPTVEDEGLQSGTRLFLAVLVFAACAFLAWRVVAG